MQSVTSRVEFHDVAKGLWIWRAEHHHWKPGDDWLPEQRVIVFGDALTERGGKLLVWSSPWHEKRALPALRELLKLPFEQVIISHCDHEPVHSRSAYERALELPPWKG